MNFVVLLLLCCTPLALNALSRYWVAAQMSELAAIELANDARMPALLHWSLRELDDVVARRVFNANWFQADADGLKVRGSHFEFGLRIARSIDLIRFSRLRLNLRATAHENSLQPPLVKNNPTLQLIVRQTLSSAELVSEIVALPTDLSEMSTNWTRMPGCLRWSESATGLSVAPPQRAAMLRLRFEWPEQRTLLVDNVRLEMGAGQSLLDLSRRIEIEPAGGTSPVQLSSLPQCSEGAIATPDSTREVVAREAIHAIEAPASIAELDEVLGKNSTAIPIYLMPEFSRVEARLAWRDHVWDIQPSAILIPTESAGATWERAVNLIHPTTAKYPNPGMAWTIALLFAALVLWLRLSRPRNDLIELCVVLLPMLVAVIGGWIGDDLSAPLLLMIATLGLYVTSFARDAMPTLRQIGAPGAWIAAAVITTLVVLALLVVQARSGSRATASTSVLLRYAAWVILQQLVLCVFVYERVLRLCRGHAWSATWLCALLFALLHTPNAGLMLATYIGALLWLPLYQRWRALPPLMFAHFSSALALQCLAPPDWVRSAEVSLRYLL